MSTALVPLAPSDQTAPVTHARRPPQAEFLTHLIATKAQAPQTRARRRAEPEDAIAAYCASGQSPSRCAQLLSRSL